MKKIVNSLGLPLTVLLSISLIGILIMLFVLITKMQLEKSHAMIGAGATITLLMSFGLSVIYFLIGGIAFIIGKEKKNEKKTFAKKLVRRGVIGAVISFVLFFVLNIVISFFGLSITGSTLPKLITPTGQRFPLQNLQVREIRFAADRDKQSLGNCEVIIENTNPELYALNVTLKSSKTNEFYTVYYENGNNIPPESIHTERIAADYISDSCTEFSLTGADAAILQ